MGGRAGASLCRPGALRARLTPASHISFRQRASDQSPPVSGEQLSSYKPPAFRKEDENVQPGLQERCHSHPRPHGRQSIPRPLRRPQVQAQLSVASSHPSPQEDHAEGPEPAGLRGHRGADPRAGRGLQGRPPGARGGLPFPWRRQRGRQRREDHRRPVSRAGVRRCRRVDGPGEVRSLGTEPQGCRRRGPGAPVAPPGAARGAWGGQSRRQTSAREPPQDPHLQPLSQRQAAAQVSGRQEPGAVRPHGADPDRALSSHEPELQQSGRWKQ